MSYFLNKKGGLALEYAVLTACLVGALIAMQVYGKRALVGKLKESAEQIGSPYAPKGGTTSQDSTVELARHETTEVVVGRVHMPDRNYPDSIYWQCPVCGWPTTDPFYSTYCRSCGEPREMVEKHRWQGVVETRIGTEADPNWEETTRGEGETYEEFEDSLF